MKPEAIQDKISTLRAYATILETPKRETRYGPLAPPTEIIRAAVEALRYQADSLERAIHVMEDFLEGDESVTAVNIQKP